MHTRAVVPDCKHLMSNLESSKDEPSCFNSCTPTRDLVHFYTNYADNQYTAKNLRSKTLMVKGEKKKINLVL